MEMQRNRPDKRDAYCNGVQAMNQEVAEKIIRANWPPDSMQCHHLSKSLAFGLARSAQIETMKEKLIEERAYLLMLKKAQEGINLLLKKIEVDAHKWVNLRAD